MTTQSNYDLSREGSIVIDQMKGEINPIVEARHMMSQTILSHILLGLSDAGFYEYISQHSRFKELDAVEALNLDAFTFNAICEYLLGCGIFVKVNDDYELTSKGQRVFNVYTRGVVNVYLGGYHAVLEALGSVLKKDFPLNSNTLERSTKHAAAGTAHLTAPFTIPDVFDVIQGNSATTCLDLGCGTGDFLLQWVLQSYDHHGVGIDMSSEALAQARDTAQRWGVEDRLSFIEAEIGPDPLQIDDELVEKVDFVTSMYMLHEFGRGGHGAIVDVIKALKQKLPGRRLLAVEVEEIHPETFAKVQGEKSHFGRLDYRIIHQLSGQGLPRSQDKWHSILRDADCDIVEPGKKSGGSFIYVGAM